MSPHHFDQMSQKVTSLKVFSKCLCHCLCICVCNFFVFRPGQFDFQLFRTLLARYARSLNITVAKIIIMIIITIIIIIIIIRENVAVVNVFLNAPQTQILDVNEKTSIIDVVKIVMMIIFLSWSTWWWWWWWFFYPNGDDDDFLSKWWWWYFVGFQCWRSSGSLHGIYFRHGDQNLVKMGHRHPHQHPHFYFAFCENNNFCLLFVTF